MGFSYTKLRKLSMGNRVAYQYSLTDVAAAGSNLYTPFKKITGYLINETATGTSFINVSANTESNGGTNPQAYLTLKSNAGTEDGEILITGLL